MTPSFLPPHVRRNFILTIGLTFLLLATLAGSSFAAFNFSELNKTIQKGPSEALESLQSLRDGIGKGFYQAIYADTVKNPNRQVEEQIKQRFGIDFQVDLSPPKQNGKYIYADLFKYPRGYHTSAAVPNLKDSLQSDCVRVRAAQVDDHARRITLLNKRLREKKLQLEQPSDPSAPATPVPDPLIREELLRLIEVFNEDSEAQLQQAIRGIPEYKTLNDQQTLLKCYQDLSGAVDFEMKLQSILNPSRKQLEALQTFTNGRLDDFTNIISWTNVSTSQAFPKYDLLFDIDVIDSIFFGTPVSTNIRKANEVTGATRDSGGFGSYQNLANQSQPARDADANIPGIDSSNGILAGVSTDPFASTTPGGSSTEFGASSSTAAGPYCPDIPDGIQLDYSGLDGGNVAPAATITQTEAIARIREEQSLEGAVSRTAGQPLTDDKPTPVPVANSLTEGIRQATKNSQGLCQGAGSGFGNEFLNLIFCVDIDFAKVGKTWQTKRDDNCIACHLHEINRIFEQVVLKNSIRPHKNTGTVMESAICEDGFGNDVGFQFAIEYVPVKIYKDICYPQGGVTSSDYAELVGYPEIVARVNKPGFYVDCKADFDPSDAKAQERCRVAIGGESLDYEEFSKSYRDLLEPYAAAAGTDKKKIQSTEDIDKASNTWARLVGDQGIAEREVHLFLYQLGKDTERYEEGMIVKQDYQQRLQYLNTTLQDIQRTPNPVASTQRDDKLDKLMCLKGYALNPDTCASKPKDTFRAFERDINLERDRVAKITRTWNTISRDFNRETPCGMFAGSGLIDATTKAFSDKFSSSYYLSTPKRKTQTPQEQVTGQIAANTEIEDINRLLTKIDEVVKSTVESRAAERDKNEFQSDQEKSLELYSALSTELATFRSHIRGMTNWWADMVVSKQFVSKGGQKQNVLESFLEK